ncbi:MAG: hypothetical protein ACK2U1_20055 [Anaerolineales bacterium]
MTKQTRIGLMALVTVLLLLAMALPGLAKTEPPEDCITRYPVYNPAGNVISSSLFTLPGEIDFDNSGWIGEELINVCIGEVPFGVTVKKFNWLAYDDLKLLASWDWSETVAIRTVTEDDNVRAWVWDFDEEKAYQSTSGWLEIYPDGTFTLYKVYVP